MRVRTLALVLLLLCALALPAAQADYNANIRGTVTALLTYTGDAKILFKLDNQPSSHPGCKAAYFAIHADTPAGARSQLFGRLLTAYSDGKVVNIGYDSEGDCAHGWIRVHRVG